MVGASTGKSDIGLSQAQIDRFTLHALIDGILGGDCAASSSGQGDALLANAQSVKQEDMAHWSWSRNDEWVQQNGQWIKCHKDDDKWG